MDMTERFEIAQKIAQAFSPSAPINGQTLFAGRIQQLIDVMNAISQRGQHVILFGERGVGKTSLSTVIAKVNDSIPSSKINCDQSLTFATLWKKLLRDIKVTKPIQGIGFAPQQSTIVHTLADYLPEQPSPDDIRHLLQGFGTILLVIDELDRIQNTETTTLLADTIKTLSDHSVPTTLILVGVADSVTALIHEHQSVERALVQIRMPRMVESELNEIIDKGATFAGMTIDAKAKSKIARLSQGLPHYTHLVSLHAFQAAITNGHTNVTNDHVNIAIERALEKAQQSIITAHHKATSSARENMYRQVLLACALAKPDSLGYFSAVDVRVPLARVMGRKLEIPAFSQHLTAFCDEKRGPILQRIGEARRFRYRFINPLMQPFVVMDGLRNALIDESQFAS